MSDVCSANYFKTVLSSALSNEEFGTDICVPCNDLCDECFGPETVIGSNGCQSCKYALQWPSQCVEECNRSTGKLRLPVLVLPQYITGPGVENLKKHACKLYRQGRN